MNAKESDINFTNSPPHPGRTLKKDFLEPLDMTQTELSDRLDIPYPRVNEIINGKRGITPETAVLLEKLFQVSADFWMDLQKKYDVYHAKNGPAKVKAEDIEPIKKSS